MSFWDDLVLRLQQTFQPQLADLGPQRVQTACAVLLLECARADFELGAPETAVIRRAMAQWFGLGTQEVDALIAQATAESRETVSLHRYVERINAEFSLQDKVSVLRLLWRVAYADGMLDPKEELLIRRLADLLYVPHREFIASKLAESGEGTNG
jgi:uncharacterized tellurite resistance protein B-like protein